MHDFGIIHGAAPPWKELTLGASEVPLAHRSVCVCVCARLFYIFVCARCCPSAGAAVLVLWTLDPFLF
jgi:hypothetical protein